MARTRMNAERYIWIAVFGRVIEKWPKSDIAPGFTSLTTSNTFLLMLDDIVDMSIIFGIGIYGFDLDVKDEMARVSRVACQDSTSPSFHNRRGYFSLPTP